MILTMIDIAINQTVNGIHIGLSTHIHDHEIFPSSLRMMNTTASDTNTACKKENIVLFELLLCVIIFSLS